MQVTVRALEKRDIERIAALESELFACPWKQQTFLSFFERLDFYGLAIEEQTQDENRIIGYLCGNYLFEQAEIATIGVEKNRQNKGYGKLLLDFFLAEMQKKGVEEVFLEVRVSASAALHLYESRGFVKTRLRKGYYEDGEDAWEMKKQG